jgi:uncharacterized membrane protein YqhA
LLSDCPLAAIDFGLVEAVLLLLASLLDQVLVDPDDLFDDRLVDHVANDLSVVDAPLDGNLLTVFCFTSFNANLFHDNKKYNWENTRQTNDRQNFSVVL